MARHPIRDRYGDEAMGTLPSDQCEACDAADPQVRHIHYLALARQMSFDALEAHLWQSARARTTFDADKTRLAMGSIMAWVKDQVLSYPDIADEQTGAKLSWWDGRQQTILALRRSTEIKAKEADAARAVREQGHLPHHAALMPLRVPRATVLREPGDDEVDEDEIPVAERRAFLRQQAEAFIHEQAQPMEDEER